MKRINPQTNAPFRCGDVNPDTRQVFRGYNKTRIKRDGFYVELWLSPESFAAIRERMKLRARKVRQAAAFQRVRTADRIIEALG